VVHSALDLVISIKSISLPSDALSIANDPVRPTIFIPGTKAKTLAAFNASVFFFLEILLRKSRLNTSPSLFLNSKTHFLD
jgi:hypothetical protein